MYISFLYIFQYSVWSHIVSYLFVAHSHLHFLSLWLVRESARVLTIKSRVVICQVTATVSVIPAPQHQFDPSAVLERYTNFQYDLTEIILKSSIPIGCQRGPITKPLLSAPPPVRSMDLIHRNRYSVEIFTELK